MSVSNNVIQGRSVGHSGTPLFARIRNPSTGALITAASLSTITYNVQDLTSGLSAGTGALTISAVEFDTLQQADPSWTQDSATNPGPDGAWGYNIKWVVPATLLKYTPTVDAQGNLQFHKFRVDLLFTPVSGEVWVVPWEFPAVPVLV